MSSARSGRRPRPRGTLTREKILDAALELIERDGVEALSMRKLAAAVGFEVMSLYNHVESKDAVLDGITGLFLARIEIPAPTDDWRQDLRALGAAYRAAARSYPQAASLALTREAVSEHGVALTAAALGAVGRAGFPPEEAVDALRAVTAIQVGTLLRELRVTAVPSRSDPRGSPERETAIRSSGFAAIEEAAAALARFDFNREHEYGVEFAIAALELGPRRDRAKRPPRSRA
jgi:AcrR family transcriptional regulator